MQLAYLCIEHTMQMPVDLGLAVVMLAAAPTALTCHANIKTWSSLLVLLHTICSTNSQKYPFCVSPFLKEALNLCLFCNDALATWCCDSV